MPVSRGCATLLLAFLLVGCGGGDADPSADDAAIEESEAPPTDAASAPAGSSEAITAPLTVDDIDRWQRGMEAELRAVQEAGTKLRSAKTGTDSLDAVMAANDMATLAAGASAAGVSPDRYQFIRATLSSAVANLSPLRDEMDISQLPPASVQELERGREASLAQLSNQLPANVVEALRPRAAELRRQDRNLTGERLRASGVG